MTLPTPEMTPSCRKLCSSPSGSVSCTSVPSASNPADISSISGFAQVKTAWNITNSRPNRMTRPNTGCSSTASSRVVSVSGFAGMRTATLMTRSASRWAARSSPMVGARQPVSLVAFSSSAANASRRSISSSMPPRRTAAAVMIGTPSSADMRSRSISTPRRVAMSIMLSTSSSGRPTRLSSITSRKARAEIGGVGDTEQQIRRRLRGETSEHDVARHFFIGTARAQRIGARQIDKADAAARTGCAARRFCARRSRPGSWRPSAGCRSAH